MEKSIRFLFCFLSCCFYLSSTAFGQNFDGRFGHSIFFDETCADERNMVMQPTTFVVWDTCIDDLFRGYGPPYGPAHPDSATILFLRYFHRFRTNAMPKSPILLGVKLNPELKDFESSGVRSMDKTFSAYIISDSSEAQLVALGITPANAKDYLYHVVEDDSLELIHWSPVTHLEQNFGATKPYGFIGKFRYPGHQILIEVVNKNNYGIRDGVVFDWRTNFKPEISQVVFIKQDAAFNLNFNQFKSEYATKFDPESHLPLDLKFPVDSVTGFYFFFRNHETMPFEFYLLKTIAGKTDTTMMLANFSDSHYLFEGRFFSQPGHYELLVQRSAVGYREERQLLRFKFDVVSAPFLGKKFSMGQLLPYLVGGGAVIALSFAAYYQYNRRRLRRIKDNGERIGLQLRSIQSQLNPHFMFNALASIQGLMNKNDIASANRYMARFANLTRRVLHTGEKEMISLNDEMSMLGDYLEMEKLRFGFTYHIRADDNIHMENTEIPVMLLQPLVENAVKHGVAPLQDSGKIEVEATREGKNLVLSVKDNGKGFEVNDPEDKQNAYGLKLSWQRIVLLNQRYGPQSLSMEINSDAAGTTVRIRLNDWI